MLELCYRVWGCVLRCGTLRPFVGHLKGSCGGCEGKNGPLAGVPAGGAGGPEGKEMAFGKGSVRYLFRCVKAFLGVQTGDMGGAGFGGGYEVGYRCLSEALEVGFKGGGRRERFAVRQVGWVAGGGVEKGRGRLFRGGPVRIVSAGL